MRGVGGAERVGKARPLNSIRTFGHFDFQPPPEGAKRFPWNSSDLQKKRRERKKENGF